MIAKLEGKTDAGKGNPSREAGLESAVQQIEKSHGKGAIMRLGGGPRARVPSIPTGCLSLDIALGIGGVPRGRVIEVFGGESSG